MKKSLAVFATLIAVPAAMSGCSPSDQAESSSPVNLTIGVSPVADLAPLYLGVNEGFFEDQGINLTINSLAASGAAVLAAVDKGNFDIGFADTVSIMVASERGLAIEAISGAAATSGDPATDYAAIVTHPDAAIESLADLRFLKVGIDVKESTNDVVAKSAVAASGIDPASIMWHEVPFVDAVGAMSDRRIDAAFVVEPFVTHARLKGFRIISHPYAEFDPALTISDYVASSKLAQENPELITRFLAALDASTAFADDQKFSTRANIGTYVTSNPPVESRLTLPRFTREFDRDAMARLADAAVTFRFLAASPDLDALLPAAG